MRYFEPGQPRENSAEQIRSSLGALYSNAKSGGMKKHGR